MSIDMFEWRFRRELRRLKPFQPNDVRDERAWIQDFPAWRALFSSMCLFGHSTGYRLPGYEDFWRYCEHAYTVKHRGRNRFAPYFKGDLLPGMRQRVGAWYESGMAETYLYACLAEAIEDKSKNGVVVYDPRVDWKLKADLIVLLHRRPLRISAFVGLPCHRPDVESRRDGIERVRKQNTLESAHWGNAELADMPCFEISRVENDMQVVNGVRLFSISAINGLLRKLYAAAGVAPVWQYPEKPRATSS